MPGAKYRLMITGFRCDAETLDDPFEWDGKGDEVFLAWSYKIVDKSGKIGDAQEIKRSPTMGDTNGWPDREAAGSRSRAGGIQSGNAYPQNPLEIPDGIPSDREFPPLIIAEPELRAGENLLFLTPTIWEWDKGATMIDQFVDWHKHHDDKFGKKAKDVFGGIWPISKPFFDAISMGIQTLAQIRQGPAGSRPIGMTRMKDDWNGFEFNPRIITLDYAKAEEYISNSPDKAAGQARITVPYADDPTLQGSYSIFIALQRLAFLPEDLPFPDGSLVREASHAEVYVIFGGAKFWIPSEEVLRRYAPRGGADVQVIQDNTLDRRTTDLPSNGTLLREFDKANVYLMRDGSKCWVKTPEALKQFGGFAAVRTVPSGELAFIPTGADIDR